MFNNFFVLTLKDNPGDPYKSPVALDFKCYALDLSDSM